MSGGSRSNSSSSEAGDPCQKLACAIQTCLAKNHYQEDKCAHAIEAWNKCVKQHKHKQQSE